MLSGILTRLGIVNHVRLRQGWRFALVGIMILAAVITPTPDPANMALVSWCRGNRNRPGDLSAAGPGSPSAASRSGGAFSRTTVPRSCARRPRCCASATCRYS